ncbi:class F sortase [Nocardioides sp. SYSU DS0651]|uniref:class F sortase n=1 Tax=Nocardioides sp. SYSU DS0651 TaxID=3415955 RepID=UPI003F4B2349
MAVALVVACCALVVMVRLLDDGERRSPRPEAAADRASASPRAATATDPCTRPDAEFRPTRITVPGVVRDAEVRPYPRDAAGVPGVPPVADKHVVAWDRGGVRAGAAEGRVLLNTHTWPDGSALGNALLRGLHRGDRVVLGGGVEAACYRVAKRVEVPAADGYPGWDAADGPHQVVIVVCSGDRLGPGQWTHRTLWFATPVS